MTEEEVMKLADSHAFNRVNKTGTSVTILDKAYVQKSDKWQGWNNFFNDQRNQYNYLIYNGARPMSQSVTNATRLIGEGKYKEAGAELAGPGRKLAELHLLVATVNFMLAMSRGIVHILGSLITHGNFHLLIRRIPLYFLILYLDPFQ